MFTGFQLPQHRKALSNVVQTPLLPRPGESGQPEIAAPRCECRTLADSTVLYSTPSILTRRNSNSGRDKARIYPGQLMRNAGPNAENSHCLGSQP